MGRFRPGQALLPNLYSVLYPRFYGPVNAKSGESRQKNTHPVNPDGCPIFSRCSSRAEACVCEGLRRSYPVGVATHGISQSANPVEKCGFGRQVMRWSVEGAVIQAEAGSLRRQSVGSLAAFTSEGRPGRLQARQARRGVRSPAQLLYAAASARVSTHSEKRVVVRGIHGLIIQTPHAHVLVSKAWVDCV